MFPGIPFWVSVLILVDLVVIAIVGGSHALKVLAQILGILQGFWHAHLKARGLKFTALVESMVNNSKDAVAATVDATTSAAGATAGAVTTVAGATVEVAGDGVDAVRTAVANHLDSAESVIRPDDPAAPDPAPQ